MKLNSFHWVLVTVAWAALAACYAAAQPEGPRDVQEQQAAHAVGHIAGQD